MPVWKMPTIFRLVCVPAVVTAVTLSPSPTPILSASCAADDKAVGIGSERLETPLDHVMDDVGHTRFARGVDADAGHRVVAPGMAQNDLADQRRRRRDAVHRIERVEDRRRARDAADRIARQHAADLDRAVRMQRRQRLRGGLPNLVGNDDVRIGVDELRQKIAVKAVHHAADADEDGDPEHDPADRDGRLTLARPEMGEGDGERQQRHGEMRTASPSLRRSGGSTTTRSPSVKSARRSRPSPTRPRRS